MTWLTDLFRWILSLLDKMVYGLIELFYGAFMLIAETRVLSIDTLNDFAHRVYAFLAIIMLFKVTFSIITYIVNPDNFTNGEKGIGKVIQNIIIALVLVVAVPYIFEEAYNLQHIILKENIVGRIILGDSSSANIMEDESIKKTISYTVLSAFIRPNNNEISSIGVDTGNPYCIQGGKKNFFSADKNNGVIKYDDDFIQCFNNLSEKTGRIYDKNNPFGVEKVGIGGLYAYAIQTHDYVRLADLITAKYINNTDIYVFEYTFIISTIAGGFVAWILLIFCFDIAVRSVKLTFLQLIAPIPIVSYVDPKSSKGGMFQKWFKACVSTYADLFIRLIAIYFAVYIIAMISSNNELYKYNGDPMTNPIIKVLIIVGALMFAKQVPKLIEDITGIKLSGDFTLNPLKKLGQSPFVAAGIGAVGAGLGSAAANLYNGIREKKGFLGTLGSTMAGLGSGSFRGLTAGLSGKGQDNAFKTVGLGLKGAVDARNLRAKRQMNGDGGFSGFARRLGDDINNLAGIESGASKFDRELSVYDEFLKEQQGLSGYLDTMIAKGKLDSLLDQFEYEEEVLPGVFTKKKADINVLKNRVDVLKANGGTAEEITRAEYDYKNALKAARKQAINKMNSDEAKEIAGFTDTIKAALSNLNYIREQNSSFGGFSDMNEIITGDQWDASEGIIKGAQAQVKSSPEYRRAQVNRRNDSNK